MHTWEAVLRHPTILKTLQLSGCCFNIKCHLIRIWIPVVKIRWHENHLIMLILIMENLIVEKMFIIWKQGFAVVTSIWLQATSDHHRKPGLTTASYAVYCHYQTWWIQLSSERSTKKNVIFYLCQCQTESYSDNSTLYNNTSKHHNNTWKQAATFLKPTLGNCLRWSQMSINFTTTFSCIFPVLMLRK